MDKIRIRGGNALKGQIVVSGAKNAALPLMTAALLADEPVTLVNVPRLADIDSMAHLLVQLGVEVAMSQRTEREMKLTGADIRDTTAPYDLVRKMRASVLVLGPLVARCRPRAGVACRAAARSAHGRSICTSRGWSGSAPRSS